LAAGATQKVGFHLEKRDLSMVTETGDIIVAQGHYAVSVGGGQPGTEAASVSGSFDVQGQIRLGE
jgi:beta-glucosidase